ncbi:SDR family NAD(P)-dependent oxidoreductase [Foetidibacter luteolus]|uniref:SDR family NAD(P)-dependent oxidoreductase n=1 Tax=Foetidibacter luteolus TaxID=2608880 RepID=UPI00129A9BA7|nr:SDR family oxidoreductase [Foetidibacter luteolus]
MNAKKALITGAASGIGRAAAQRFAAEGYDVLLLDIKEDKLGQLLNELPAGNHLAVVGSYASEAVMEKTGLQIKQHWGCLDVLVNCAGAFIKSDPMRMELPRFRDIFNIMTDGCYLTSATAAAHMTNGGRIIHITSIHGERAETGAAAYAMAKAAINQYCRAAALEFADKNILVNAIAPGFVNTAMSVVDGQNELESAWFKNNYVQGHHLPLRRAARPEEIAGVAFFLAGKDATYITGQVITVDGGLTITF